MKAMRNYLIAALVLTAAGCGDTRRDFSVCDVTYSECLQGFVCNLTTGQCVPVSDAGPASEAGVTGETSAPPDVPLGEVASPDGNDAPIGIDLSPAEAQLPLDTSPQDAPTGIEVTVPDTRVPDASGTCASDGDCGSGLPYCVSNRCVACRTSSQCNNAAGLPFCSASNTCVSCAAGPAGNVCTGATPVCDSGSGRCVECTGNGQCSTVGKAFCVANQCQGCNVPGATAGGAGSDGGTTDGGGVADGGVVASPCTGTTPVCATSGTLVGQCVQCDPQRLTGSDCSGTTPICSSANLCTACTADSQCASLPTGPGICLFNLDGRCASAAETIYVQNSSGCGSGSSAGTATTPFCNSQDGIAAITSSKRVIVMSNSNLYPVTATAVSSSGKISIIGRNTATTAAGAFVGIHVTAGDVYLRNLTIAAGTNTGIVVESGATLRLDRCVVKNNDGGGLIVQSGASFDIANSVFDNNGPAAVNTIVPFGGVYLGGSVPAGGLHRFWFSTIVNNQDRGLVCADSTQSLTGMLLYGNVAGDWVGCAMDPTNSKWQSPGTGSDVTDPAFSSTNPYHLTSSSHCKDFIVSTVAHPDDDLDGDSRPRPATGKLDCGADEY
jgi:hypothetical protein